MVEHIQQITDNLDNEDEEMIVAVNAIYMQLRKEAWKKIQDFNGVWTRDLAIPVRCSTNRAMKPLTLGAGQLWVHMFQWEKWVLMIWNKSYMNCENEMKMKKWSSQWTQFMQLRKEFTHIICNGSAVLPA